MADSGSSEHIETPVLIVGCGPSGMTMALALSQFGIASLVIDRRTSISSSPRAHVLNCRTLEIFSALGIDIAALRKVATPDEESGWVRWVDTLSGGEFGAVPYERINAPETVPTLHPLFNIAQPAVEEVLYRQVLADLNITVEKGWEWQSCDERESGSHSLVTNLEGRSIVVDSRYLIASDGAHSPIRASQNIAMEGAGFIQKFKNVHFRADLSHLTAHKPAIIYWILKQQCPGTLLAYDMRDNWVFMYPYDAAAIDSSSLTEDVCVGLARDAIGDNAIELDVVSIRDWEMTSEVASCYRSGSVFLVGDAAHRYPPSGGLGLNTGVGDAHNLAWKLAGVLQGWAPTDLLDTYDSERRPVANNNANFSLENAIKMMDVFNLAGVFAEPGEQPSLSSLKADSDQWRALQESIDEQRLHFDGLALHVGAHYGRTEAPDPYATQVQFPQVGARLPHVWLRRGGASVSSHDLLLATQFTLLVNSGNHSGACTVDVPHRVLCCPADFEVDEAALVELGLATAAVLVRPDGHIAALLPTSMALDTAINRVIKEGIAA